MPDPSPPAPLYDDWGVPIAPDSHSGHIGGVNDDPSEAPDAAGAGATPPARDAAEQVSAWVEEDLDLDDVDFAPVLTAIEAMLPEARRLAGWADEGEVGDWLLDEVTGAPLDDEFTGQLIRKGEFGSVGADMLSRLAEQWLDVERLLSERSLWASPVAKARWEDERRHTAVCCLRDLADRVFVGRDWVERQVYLDDGGLESTYFPLILAPGSRLGMPHGLFVRRLMVVAELLREIVAEEKSPKRRMTVAEADAKARALTDTPAQREKFFAMRERKQAKMIGCHWETWRKTKCFEEALNQGLLEPRKNAAKVRVTRRRKPAVVSLTTALEATVGMGEGDEILKQLVAAESEQAQTEISQEEYRKLIAEHRADATSDPSPLGPVKKIVRDRKTR
jgi:hypothetical protein